MIMPKLDELMTNEFAQAGTENGVELYRQLSRKIDPPRSDLAFDFKAEIKGLNNHTCSSFAQTARFCPTGVFETTSWRRVRSSLWTHSRLAYDNFCAGSVRK